MMCVLIRAITAAILLLAAATTSMPRSYATTNGASHTSAAPTLSPDMWNKLATLPSYHIESSLKMTGSISQTISVLWTEDSHGPDYHLIVHASTVSGEFYVVKGHYYIGAAGHFVDAGSTGKQILDPIKALTLGYWSTLAQNAHGVRYVGRVVTNGRLADRFKVLYALMAPGITSGTTVSGSQSVSYTSTVDIDVKTHAPLHVTGTFHGSDGQGHALNLVSSISVTHIGQIPAIKVPPTISIPGL